MSEPSVQSGNVGDIATIILNEPSSNSVVEVAPAAGFNAFRFVREIDGKQVPILYPTDSAEELRAGGTGYGFPLLFPFPNRVKDGRYSANGKDYVVTDNAKSGNHIHGLVIDREWKHIESGVSSELGAFVTGTFQPTDYPERFESQYPFSFRFSLTYSLKDGELTVDTIVENTGDEPLPFGYGSHPYFSLPLLSGGTRQACEIQVPANRIWELVDCMPTEKRLDVDGKYDCRELRALGEDTYDDVFTDLLMANGQSTCILRDNDAGLQIRFWADDSFREWVVYAPPGQPFICFEPYTCPTDAVNMQARGIDCGWIELPAGETWQAKKGVRLERV